MPATACPPVGATSSQGHPGYPSPIKLQGSKRADRSMLILAYSSTVSRMLYLKCLCPHLFTTALQYFSYPSTPPRPPSPLPTLLPVQVAVCGFNGTRRPGSEASRGSWLSSRRQPRTWDVGQARGDVGAGRMERGVEGRGWMFVTGSVGRSW